MLSATATCTPADCHQGPFSVWAAATRSSTRYSSSRQLPPAADSRCASATNRRIGTSTGCSITLSPSTTRLSCTTAIRKSLSVRGWAAKSSRPSSRPIVNATSSVRPPVRSAKRHADVTTTYDQVRSTGPGRVVTGPFHPDTLKGDTATATIAHPPVLPLVYPNVCSAGSRPASDASELLAHWLTVGDAESAVTRLERWVSFLVPPADRRPRVCDDLQSPIASADVFLVGHWFVIGLLAARDQ